MDAWQVDCEINEVTVALAKTARRCGWGRGGGDEGPFNDFWLHVNPLSKLVRQDKEHPNFVTVTINEAICRLEAGPPKPKDPPITITGCDKSEVPVEIREDGSLMIDGVHVPLWIVKRIAKRGWPDCMTIQDISIFFTADKRTGKATGIKWNGHAVSIEKANQIIAKVEEKIGKSLDRPGILEQFVVALSTADVYKFAQAHKFSERASGSTDSDYYRRIAQEIVNYLDDEKKDND